MTKAMELSVDYDGYYGGSVNEILLLPLDINGVLFEELEEKTYDRAVYLGEIEGKHSEVYGDLTVRFVDLDTLPVREVSELIKASDFGEFEGFFERIEGDFQDDEDEYNIEKVKELLNSYNVKLEKYMIKTSFVNYEFIEQLKEKYVQKFKNVTVLDDDYDLVVKLLNENNIKYFD